MRNKIKINFREGLTLVEMLMAIFIFVMIMGGSVYLLSWIYNRYGFAMEQGMSVNKVQRSLKIMVEEIRRAEQADSGAYAVQDADDFDFVFFADMNDDNVAERIHYYLEDEEVKKGVAEPSGTPPTYPNGDQTITVIADHVKNTTDQPLLYYFDENYPTDQANNPLATPVASVIDIRLVKIDIYFNLDPYHSPDNVRLESYVEMRNLKDNW